MPPELLAMGERSYGRRPLPAAEERALTRADPLALIRAVEASGRFRRDSRLGAILHGGKVSFRELTPTESLHILIDGNRISAHVDEVLPLHLRPDGTSRYSLARVVTHNLAVARGELLRRLRGTHGHQRCNMTCEAVWMDDDQLRAEATGDAGHEGGCEAAQPG